MTSLRGNRLQKPDKLLKRHQFVCLSRQGSSVYNRHFVIAYRANQCGRPRLGITVTRKIGTAVARNRIKRVVREYFRRNRHRVMGNYDINVIAKKPAVHASTQQAFLSLQELFNRIGRHAN